MLTLNQLRWVAVGLSLTLTSGCALLSSGNTDTAPNSASTTQSAHAEAPTRTEGQSSSSADTRAPGASSKKATGTIIQEDLTQAAQLDTVESPLTALPPYIPPQQTIFTLLDALERADESFVWALTDDDAREALETPAHGQSLQGGATPESLRELLAAVGQDNLSIQWCTQGNNVRINIAEVDDDQRYCLVGARGGHTVNLLFELPESGDPMRVENILPVRADNLPALRDPGAADSSVAGKITPLQRSFSGHYAAFLNGQIELPKECVANASQVSLSNGFGASGDSFVYVRPPLVPFPAAGPDALAASLECHFQGKDLFHTRIGIFNPNGTLLGQIALRDTPAGDAAQAGIIERFEVLDTANQATPSGSRLRAYWVNHFMQGDYSCHLCFEGEVSYEVDWTGNGLRSSGQ